MICPVDLASDLSAWRAARIGDHGRYGSVSEGRGGAGDESAGSHVAGGLLRDSRDLREWTKTADGPHKASLTKLECPIQASASELEWGYSSRTVETEEKVSGMCPV